MAGKGGVRPGAGRPPKAEEEKSQQAAYKALMDRYGSPDAAFGALLDSEEPALIKFTYEWAFGKPKERVEQSGGLELIWAETKTYEA